MLDHALNDALSRVGSGTPMGETMRRYWLPAIETVKDDGDPMGVAPTYYNIRAAEGMFPKGEAWRESLVRRMHS